MQNTIRKLRRRARKLKRENKINEYVDRTDLGTIMLPVCNFATLGFVIKSNSVAGIVASCASLIAINYFYSAD